MRAHGGEISTSELCCVMCDFCIECGGLFRLEARRGLGASIEFQVSWCAGIVKMPVSLLHPNWVGGPKHAVV